eukprot:991483_1
MGYSHRQPSCMYLCTLIWGIICWIGIIAGLVLAFVLQLYYLFGSISGLWYGAFQLFIVQHFKNLIIEDVNEKSLGISFGYFNGQNKLMIDYDNIISIGKMQLGAMDNTGCDCCKGKDDECECCGTGIMNANGCGGGKCRCCCGEMCDNTDMIEISL